MVKRYLIITLFFIIIFSNKSFSQANIKGQIVDHNNISIMSAEVFLLKQNKIIKTELPNDNGFFDFDVEKGIYTLQVINNGVLLLSKEINVVGNIDLGFVKLEKNHELKEVVVQNKKQIFKREFDKTIFLVENSPLKEGYNALEVLQRSPKLTVNSDGKISLKNGAPSISINGRKLNLSSIEVANYLEGLNSEGIKQIEIQEVGSSEADASDNGGTINIVTKKNPKGFSSLSKVYLGYKEENYQKYRLGNSLLYGSDKWNLYSRVNYNDNDDRGEIKSTTRIFSINEIQQSEGFFNENNRVTTVTNGAVFYPNKKNEFGVEFFYNNQKRKVDVYTDLNRYNQNQLETSSENSSLTNTSEEVWYGTFNYSLKKDTIGSTIKFIGDIGQNDIDNTNNIEIDYSVGDLSNSKSRFISNGGTNYNTFQIDWKQYISKKNNLNAGIKNNFINRKNTLTEEVFTDDIWQLNPEGSQDFTNKENILAGYFTLNTSWKERHTFKVGLRIENTFVDGFNKINNESVKQNYTNLFPSFYYSYGFDNNSHISLSYSKSIQRPSFRDLNPFVLKINDFFYQKGNPNLQPQFSNKIDFSYTLKKHELSFYMNFANDVIAGAFTLANEDVRIFQTQNFGNENYYGINYDYSGDLTKWLFLNFEFGTKYYQFTTEDNSLKTERVSFLNSIYTNIKFSKTLSIDVYSVYFSKYQLYVLEDGGAYNFDLSIRQKVFNNNGLIKLSFLDIFNTMRAKNRATYESFELEFYQKRLTQSVALYFQYKIGNNKKVNDKSVHSENQIRQRL